MTVTDELLENNAEFARNFSKGDLPMPPGKGLAVVACMDARLNVYALLGLAEGQAHVIRNAGGVVTEDVIRSLAISQHLLGTKEIILVHHTDCGMLTFTNDQIRDMLKTDTGADASSIDFLPFDDVEQSVRDDVATVRNSPLIPNDIPVTGFVYDVRTGRLTEVR